MRALSRRQLLASTAAATLGGRMLQSFNIQRACPLAKRDCPPRHEPDDRGQGQVGQSLRTLAAQRHLGAGHAGRPLSRPTRESQRSIDPTKQSYDYDFPLTTPGTHWMHAHTLQEQQVLAAVTVANFLPGAPGR